MNKVKDQYASNVCNESDFGISSGVGAGRSYNYGSNGTGYGSIHGSGYCSGSGLIDGSGCGSGLDF